MQEVLNQHTKSHKWLEPETGEDRSKSVELGKKWKFFHNALDTLDTQKWEIIEGNKLIWGFLNKWKWPKTSLGIAKKNWKKKDFLKNWKKNFSNGNYIIY